MDFTWIAEIEEFTSPALTVRAQAISPNDQEQLVWDVFFPRNNVDSIELREMTTRVFRPVADRREWNQRGRVIPMLTPSMREMTMVPIESTDHIQEYELARLFERFGGVPDLVRNQIGVDIPDRVDTLVLANYRRLELDAMEAWANGQIIQRDPQTGRTFTASFGFDAGRYQVAATDWATAADAYSEFIAWLREGVEEVGSLSGAHLRQSTLLTIKADAPTDTGIELSTAQLQDQVSQDLGQAFTFYPNERTVHEFTDGGIEYVTKKIWPANHVALVPAGQAVGTTAFAPVVRAQMMSSQVPDASIDIRGVTVVHEANNGGRELTIEAQLNAMPVPDEQRMWVIDAGA